VQSVPLLLRCIIMRNDVTVKFKFPRERDVIIFASGRVAAIAFP